MASYRTRIALRAQKDMRDIAAYIIRELLQPEAALSTIYRLSQGIASLAEMPERFALVSDDRLARRGIRKLGVDRYLIFFTIHEENAEVNVLAVLHARRDWQNIL